VKNLESYGDSHYQAEGKYRFCNPLGCRLESIAEIEDKRPYVALGLIFDRKRNNGPTVHKMENTFIPGKDSEKNVLPQQVPQDHAFAKVLVNPQYVFKSLTSSLNSLLEANPLLSDYLVEPYNKFAKTVQQPLCFDGTIEESQDN